MSLTTTVAALLATELRATLRHNLRLGAIYGVAGLGLLGGIGFGLSALHRMIAETQGPLHADLIIGAGLLVFAAILIGIAQYLARRARRRAVLVQGLAAASVAAGAMIRKPKVGVGALVAVLAISALAGRTLRK